MASLGGSAVIRHDLPLFGSLNRPSLPGMEEDLKKSVYDDFTCSAAVGNSTAVGSGPMMKACFWCGYASIRVSDLMTHMKTTHPLEYTANEAEMSSGLPRVSGSASPAIAPLGEDSMGAAAAARRYKCFSCEARFCRSGTLMDHMRRNHPESCVSLSDARRLSNGSLWSVAGSSGMSIGTAAAAAASAHSPRPAPARLLSAACGGSESCSPAAAGMAADASADAFSRKRMLQRAMSTTAADDDEDDDELDIKVIRLVKTRLAAGDNLGGSGRGSSSSSEMPFFGKLHASTWPGQFFRSAASVRDGFVEQQDLGCLLGALHNSSATSGDSSGRRSGAAGISSCVESTAASGSEGDCSSSGGGSEQQQQQASVGSIRVVRVSGMHASIVAGGAGAGMEMTGGGGAASNSIGSQVASSGLRAPEKYKCFWCDAHFRKRGKLMDHIDLFHKDSKQQTEVQAELLSSSGGSGAATFGSESKQQLQQRSTVGQPDAAAAAAGSKHADSRRCVASGQQTPGSKLASPSGAAAAASANCATVAAVANSAPSCRFFLRSASLSESEQPASDVGRPKHVGSRLCRFYLGKLANPLTACSTGAHVSHGHAVGRIALSVPPPCSGAGGGMAAAGAASAVALNLGFALGPQSATAAAFGPPYAAMYCVSGGPGSSSNGVRFYQHQQLRHHHHAKSNFANVAYAQAQSKAYQLGAGAILPPGLERLPLPAPTLQEAATAGASAAFQLRRKPQASGSDLYHSADSPLDLSSRNGRQ